MEKQKLKPYYTTLQLLVIYAGVLALFTTIFQTAWVCEDAYITFRVIDNFFNGFGLRWNIHERVDPYTHPLWMLLHIPIHAVWGNLYHTTIILSIACTMGAILLTLYTLQKSVLVVLGCFLLPLFLSKSFIDYATSGLESPLSYLTFAAFGYVLLRKHSHPRFWFYLSLSVALALFNRLDTVIIYLPMLLWLVWTRWSEVRWGQIALGALPLIGWFAFSLFYYGFLFPNTKYAKLDTGMATWLYVQQGLRYAKYLFIGDTAGSLTLLSVIPILFWRKNAKALPTAIHALPICLGFGIFGYCLYVIYIGGDYMTGRFWAFPIFTAVWLFYVCMPERIRFDILFLIGCLLGTGYFMPSLFKMIKDSCQNCIPVKGRVIDARWIFYKNKLVVKNFPLRMRLEGRYQFAEDGKKMAANQPLPVRQMYYVGMTPYYAGPYLKVIDQLALADPLLSHLPARQQQNFYVGHFQRTVPKGYMFALKTGSLMYMDPSLAKYYEKLRLITSGELWSWERLRTIAEFNLGMYDHWKDEYLSRNKP